MSGEHRVDPRVPVRLKVVYARDRAPVSALTYDLSKGGTFVLTPEPFPLRTELNLAFSIPDRDEPLRVRGKVIWVAMASARADDLPAGMGIMFVWEDQAQRRSFEETIVPLLAGPAPAEGE